MASLATATEKKANYLQDDEDLTQEYKELVASLPTEAGWVAARLHRYQGFWHTTRQMQGVLNCQRHFQARPSDILLVSFPKSGTTWLKALAFATLNRHTLPLSQAQAQAHPLLTKSPHVLVPFLELDLYLNQSNPQHLASLPSPRLLASHLPYVSLPNSARRGGCKIIYLYRDPKDTFVSLWHFTNRLRLESQGQNSLEEAFEKFCQGVSLYGPLWEHVAGYYEAKAEAGAENVMVVRYEEIKEETERVVREIGEFMGCGFSEEEERRVVVKEIVRLCSFESLRDLEVNKKGRLWTGEENRAFFRRGQVGDSNNLLTLNMIKCLDSITQTKLAKYGFTL